MRLLTELLKFIIQQSYRTTNTKPYGYMKVTFKHKDKRPIKIIEENFINDKQ